MSQFLRLGIVLAVACLWLHARDLPAEQPPRAIDERLTVELFAEHPEIMTPTGLAVDARGRVFVAESHTHFRPDDYDGPPADRLLIFEDSDGDGRADKRTIFHEGFVYVMDLEFHQDGSLYVATRKDIHRLRDTDGDDRADEVTLIVRLDTKGNYPHNGLSGIAWDFRGGFHFGLGENLGEPYTLIGSDGVQIRGGGEGGSTYHVGADGQHLRRVSTGWWNPYGMCTDSFGRVFGTDNDPDSSPPCRLIQVVEDGDYGYEFRYGRSGRNPLITWDGEIPGTLPMIAGTGEAPCHIVAYESDALPSEYFGNLLVPSWADHRVERYVLEQKPDRGLVATKRQILVEGPDDFRPVGIDVAPDGTIYLSDWVSSSYALHRLGRVWRIRPKVLAPRKQPMNTEQQLLLPDRRLREKAATDLVKTDAGRAALRRTLIQKSLPQARATAMIALLQNNPAVVGLSRRLSGTMPLELQILAAQLDTDPMLPTDRVPPTPVEAAILPHVKLNDSSLLTASLRSADPWLQHAAVTALSRILARSGEDWLRAARSGPQLPVLLAMKRARATQPEQVKLVLNEFLSSSDASVRFAAVKWVADDSLADFREKLTKLLDAPDLDLRTFLALNVALDRLAGKPVTDRPSPDRLKSKIVDEQASPALRRLCLRLVDPAAAKLELATLSGLLRHSDGGIQLEAIRAIARHSDEQRLPILSATATDPQRSSALRAEAVSGLALTADRFTPVLLELAHGADPLIRDEALRALVAVPLEDGQRSSLRKLDSAGPAVAEAVARIVDQKLPQRPASQDAAAWGPLISQPGNAESGERIFLGTKVGRCSTCHQVAGLGASVGPDLSQMSRRVAANGTEGTTWLLETILQPSRDMGPQFTPWQIVTKDGKQYIGLPRRKGGNSEAYLGTDGREFSLQVTEIESRHEATVSIMPSDLLQQLTRQELADLFAFLTASR